MAKTGHREEGEVRPVIEGEWLHTTRLQGAFTWCFFLLLFFGLSEGMDHHSFGSGTRVTYTRHWRRRCSFSCSLVFSFLL